MRRSNLPNSLFVFFAFVLLGSSAFFGCGHRKFTPIIKTDVQYEASAVVVDINTAGYQDLLRLPHIGPELARKILEHRTQYGPFRRPEHLLIIEGVSEERYRDIRPFIDTR